MPATWLQRRAWIGLLAIALWAFAYRLGDVPLLDDPNEGEYAEVAREMLESGDWISPQLNYTLFLNKPPLTFWLIAAGHHLFGIGEFAARLPSALAAVLIVLLVVRLGALLFDRPTGMLAGLILIATGGFLLEARTSRPDLLLAAGLVGALTAFVYLLRVPRDTAEWHRAVRWPMVAWQVSLAAGILAKGFLGIVLPGLICAVLVVTERRVDLVRRLLHPRAWWLFGLLVVPWHLAVSLRHPGFAWDYLVHQHILVFFDRKVPRDSEPVPVAVFWAALAGRLFPWTLLVPLSLVAAWQRIRRQDDACGHRLLLAWMAVVLLFFTAASSRMEHYSIPALPAFALVLARLFREYAVDRRARGGRLMTVHLVAFAALAMSGPFVVPGLVAAQDWLSPLHELGPLARTIFTLFAAGMVVTAAVAVAGRRAWVAPMMAAVVVLEVPFIVHGLRLLARVNSSAPLAAAVTAVAEPDDRIVFEAPVEYQNGAGLNFYLRRRLDLLAHAAFVPPAYLRPHTADLFLDREHFEALWQHERVFLITDPLAPRTSLADTVPEPRYIVARDPVRWVVTNRPFR